MGAPKVTESAAQIAAEQKAQLDAQQAAAKQQQENQAIAAGQRGRAALLSSAGGAGYPSKLGGTS